MKPLLNPTLEKIYQTTELWFSDKLVDFSELVTNELVGKAEQSTVTSIQAQCFTAIHSIRSTGSRSILLFMESLKKNFQTNTIKPDLNDDLYSITHGRKNQLDLLTTKDLEDSLSYETAIDKLHKHNKEGFEHLEVRVYELLKQSGESVSSCPIRAESIISAFRDSLDLFDFTPEIRIEVYKLFEKFMDAHLPELLDKLNQLLIDAGFLPEIDPDYFIKKLSRNQQAESPTPADEEISTPGSQPQTEPAEVTNITAFPSGSEVFQANDIISRQNDTRTAHSVPGHSTLHSNPDRHPAETGRQDLSSRLMDLANRLSRSDTVPASQAQANTQDTPAKNSPLQQGQVNNNPRDDSDQPESGPVQSPELSKSTTTHPSQAQINSLLAYSSSGQGASENSLRTLSENYMKVQNKGISSLITSSYNNQYDVSTDELVQAVINIGNSAPDHHQADSTRSITEKIREEVLTGINKSSQNTELKNKKLFLIEMIETLFDHICNNKNLSSTAIHLFRSLTIPVIHLSLVDDAFIDNSEHPARLFLEDFADAALGISDDEDSQNNPLYLKLHKLIEQASQEDHINSSFFSELHEDLKRFIQYRKQQANIKSPSSRIQIEKKIDAIIFYHTRNRDIPKNMLLILKKVWKKVMLNTYFNDSYNEDDWEKSKAFIATVINSIQPVNSGVEYKRRERLIPVLRQEFEDGLIQINLPFEQKIKLLKYLDTLHNNALTAGHKQQDIPASQPAPEKTPAAKKPVDKELSREIVKDITTESEQQEEPVATSQNSEQDNVIHLISSDNLNPSNQENSPHSRKLSVTDYELVRLATQGYKLKNTPDDQYASMVKQLEVEDWIEFRFKSRISRAKITWISEDKTQFNCLTQNNHVVELTLAVLSHSFRNNIATVISHHSIINDAIKETAGTLTPEPPSQD